MEQTVKRALPLDRASIADDTTKDRNSLVAEQVCGSNGIEQSRRQLVGVVELPDLGTYPEVQQIAEYLRSMKLKHRAFGGVDEVDVLTHIDTVTRMYNEALSTLHDSVAEKIAKGCGAVEASFEVREKERQEAFEKSKRRLEEEYRAKADQLLASLGDIEALRLDVLEKAKAEAQRIVQQARAEAEDIVRDAKESIERAEQEKIEHEQLMSRLRDEAAILCLELRRVAKQAEAALAASSAREGEGRE